MRELHDRDRGGVGRQHRIRVGDDLVEFGEDLALDLLVLDDGLHDELPVGEVAEIGGEAQPPCGLLPLTLGDLAAAHTAVQRPQDAGAPGRRELAGLLEHQHVDIARVRTPRRCPRPSAGADTPTR